MSVPREKASLALEVARNMRQEQQHGLSEKLALLFFCLVELKYLGEFCPAAAGTGRGTSSMHF